MVESEVHDDPFHCLDGGDGSHPSREDTGRDRCLDPTKALQEGFTSETLFRSISPKATVLDAVATVRSQPSLHLDRKGGPMQLVLKAVEAVFEALALPLTIFAFVIATQWLKRGRDLSTVDAARLVIELVAEVRRPCR